MFTFRTRKITVLSKRFQSDPVVLNRLGLPLRQTCKCHSVNEWVWLLSHNVFDDIQQVIRVLIKEITMSVDNCILHRFTCTTQLYNWLWNWAFGRLVISTNTSQSITNLRNCCGVISECNCGGLATGALISDWEAWGTATPLLRPIMVRISPNTPTPSSFNRGRSNNARLSHVSFSVTKISA